MSAPRGCQDQLRHRIGGGRGAGAGGDGAAGSGGDDELAVARAKLADQLRAASRAGAAVQAAFRAVPRHLFLPATERAQTVDLDAELAGAARVHLAEAGYAGITVICGDGAAGVSGHAPYDRIIVTAGGWDLAPHWLAQLAPGGQYRHRRPLTPMA